MAKKDSTYPNAPSGLLVSELQAGYLYQCRLSGLPVLVVDEPHRGPDPKDPRKTDKTLVRRGRYYNAVYGVHQWCELVDRQLTKYAAVPTEK